MIPLRNARPIIPRPLSFRVRLARHSSGESRRPDPVGSDGEALLAACRGAERPEELHFAALHTAAAEAHSPPLGLHYTINRPTNQSIRQSALQHVAWIR